jgi:vancomycin permeability regulator SanA
MPETIDTITPKATTHFTADVIIVLGAAVKPNGIPSNALLRRVQHAVTLWKAGLAPRLLMTGGVGQFPPSEAEVMQAIAIKSGVPEEAILLESQGVSTLDSAQKCLQLLKKTNIGSLSQLKAIIVTDNWHMGRSLMTFRHVGLSAQGDALNYQEQKLTPLRFLSYVIREALALIWYRILFMTRFRKPVG